MDITKLKIRFLSGFTKDYLEPPDMFAKYGVFDRSQLSGAYPKTHFNNRRAFATYISYKDRWLHWDGSKFYWKGVGRDRLTHLPKQPLVLWVWYLSSNTFLLYRTERVGLAVDRSKFLVYKEDKHNTYFGWVDSPEDGTLFRYSI